MTAASNAAQLVLAHGFSFADLYDTGGLARLDERFKHAVGAVGPLAQIQRELTTLRTRLDRIEAHLGIVEHDDEASRDDG